MKKFSKNTNPYFGIKHRSFITFFLFVLLLIGCDCNKNNGSWTPDILNPELQKEHFLPDYSYAGYKWGEESIPEVIGTILDITEFGAVANDKKDDTEAILAAVKKAHETEDTVIVYFPAGRFILKKIVNIERSNIVIRGERRGEKNLTTLYMPLALNELPIPENLAELDEYLLLNDKRQREKDRGVDEPFSLYAWSGGYFWTNYPGARGKSYLSKYNETENVLAKIKSGKRGGHEIIVEDGSKLHPNSIVKINWYNVEGEKSSLVKYLYDKQDVNIGSRHWETPDIPLTKQEVTVLKFEGDKVTIKEPLMHDLRPEWTPDITEWNYISGVGIENLDFEFLYQEYKYHHVEYGFNAIYLTNTTHSWVRNINFRNGDSGVLTDLCSNVTFENIDTYGRKYHYAVHFGDCYNMLARDLYVQAPVVHSLTFNTGSRSCIYTNCVVTTMPTLDQHSGLNYQNLFDNIFVYIDDPEHEPITMGGAKYWSPSHAAFSTFWNVHFEFLFENPGNDTIKIKGVTDSPSERLVGITGNYPVQINYPINTYEEGTNKSKIAIPSLYEYQLKKRLKQN